MNIDQLNATDQLYLDSDNNSLSLGGVPSSPCKLLHAIASVEYLQLREDVFEISK